MLTKFIKVFRVVVTISTFVTSQIAWTKDSRNFTSPRPALNLQDLALKGLAISNPSVSLFELGHARNSIQAILNLSDAQMYSRLTSEIEKTAAYVTNQKEAEVKIGLLVIARNHIPDMRTNLLAKKSELDRQIQKALRGEEPSAQESDDLGDYGTLNNKCFLNEKARSVASISEAANSNHTELSEKKPCNPILNEIEETFSEKYEKYKKENPSFGLSCSESIANCLGLTALWVGAAALIATLPEVAAATFTAFVSVIFVTSWYRELTRPEDQASCYPYSKDYKLKK